MATNPVKKLTPEQLSAQSRKRLERGAALGGGGPHATRVETWDVNLRPLEPAAETMKSVEKEVGLKDIVITPTNPERDAQLKRGIELQIQNFTKKGKKQETAIIEAISTPELPLSCSQWRVYAKQPRFKEYQAVLLQALTRRTETRRLHTIDMTMQVLEMKMADILEKGPEYISKQDMKTIATVLSGLNRGRDLLMRAQNINVDNRSLSMQTQTTQNIQRAEIAAPVDVGGAREHLEWFAKNKTHLDKYLGADTLGTSEEPVEVEAEIVEGEIVPEPPAPSDKTAQDATPDEP